jgi:hypothetical protein
VQPEAEPWRLSIWAPIDDIFALKVTHKRCHAGLLFLSPLAAASVSDILVTRDQGLEIVRIERAPDASVVRQLFNHVWSVAFQPAHLQASCAR